MRNYIDSLYADRDVLRPLALYISLLAYEYETTTPKDYQCSLAENREEDMVLRQFWYVFPNKHQQKSVWRVEANSEIAYRVFDEASKCDE